MNNVVIKSTQMSDQVVELKVEGMTCNHCAAGVSRFLEKKGLKEVYVNYATKEVRFTSHEVAMSLDEVKAGIEDLGFTVAGEVPSQPFWTLERKLLFCAIFTAPLLLDHLIMMFGISGFSFLHEPWVQFALCLPVFVIGIFHFGRSAWGSLKAGVPNMDVLIFIGSTAAFIYSLIGTIQQQPAYIFYETAAMIITLVLVGNWLEKRAVDQTTTAIDDLAKLKVETARRLLADGRAEMLPVDQIRIGDRLQINAGDSIPLDGQIQSGAGAVDESMLSGESIPVEKQAGDRIIGASVLVDGQLQVEVTATGQDTVLSKMIEMVKMAQMEKPDIQRLADRISAIFVPVVLVIAGLTFLIATFGFGLAPEKAIMNAIAVLVISCPCAMGLATPTAVMVGVGRVSRSGILIRGGQTLETFAGIQRMVFDKTGTLTTGEFRLANIQAHGVDIQEVKNLLYALEQHSSHPLAASLLTALQAEVSQEQLPSIQQIREIKGMGLEATMANGDTIRLGSWKMAETLTNDYGHDMYLLRNDRLIATVDLVDEIKPEAQDTLKQLMQLGIEPILLSGDRQTKVAETADRLGITTYYAEQLPDEKLKKIEQFAQEIPTAMVGDGINDAPALARATIGVSLSDASQVAIQSAQIVLLGDRLDGLIKAVSISRHTLLTIKQNLFWAFAYNVVAIPIAALGFLNPMWGAFFMAVSDVVVIGNSIRLKYKKIK